MYLHSKFPIQQRDLRLRSVAFAARNVILDFGSAWAQVQLFTHTNLQIYTRSEWYDTICLVDKNKRGFKIGIAFEFEEWVLAFPTMDFLICVYWRVDRESLPSSIQHDIYDDWLGFLGAVVSWVKIMKPKNDRGMLAITAVRHATMELSPAQLAEGRTPQRLFAGAGVYTVVEFFFLAGLSPSLTLYDLLHEGLATGSRLARLLVAFRQIAIHARLNIWNIIRRNLHGWLIAASVKDRLRYLREFYVYGKDISYVTPRQKVLLGSEWDLFEPSHLHVAMGYKNNLGYLIYGTEAWPALAEAAGLSVGTPDDPLSLYFRNVFAKGYPTPRSLCPTIYTELGLYIKKLGKIQTNTYFYRNTTGDKCSIWSIYDVDVPSLTRLTGTPREQQLLKEHISGSLHYNVGPLDFCGVARVVSSQGKGNHKIMVCELDPRLPDFYVDRRETSRVMMTLGTDTTLNSLPVSKQPTKRRRSINMHDEDTGPVISSSKLPSAVKRTKRKGADALLLADAEGDLVVQEL
ncbi:hypothetical protein FIBSPDRAFT_959913 [Athelia psychrophila]|uniref:Uncharacterized protein n=1 Tax=Athelia psychrophila TaxID=1759441 RepID=A0A166D0V2_9AGAM|nr:hypothetical protein FIBSPDRAFT_959913 [Fibularhizoctonia sp. CBS 109695]